MTDQKRRAGAKQKSPPDARATAARALQRVDAGAYSNLMLEGACAQEGLNARETAFASALFYTALERRLKIGRAHV